MKFDEIKDAFKGIFLEKKEIIASYLYGSVLYSEFYKDIDVGILIINGFEPNVMYEAKLAGKLEKKYKDIFKITKTVDVRVLNGKSLRFLFSVLKNSKIIFSRKNHERVQFEARTMKEFLDIKPHFEMYDNMRKLRYANR